VQKAEIVSHNRAPTFPSRVPLPLSHPGLTLGRSPALSVENFVRRIQSLRPSELDSRRLHRRNPGRDFPQGPTSSRPPHVKLLIQDESAMFTWISTRACKLTSRNSDKTKRDPEASIPDSDTATVDDKDQDRPSDSYSTSSSKSHSLYLQSS
jgi:hypothetical protein